MLDNSVSNTKLKKVAEYFDKNNLQYTNQDLAEFYNNLKNFFVLLTEAEVERVNKIDNNTD